MISEKGSLKETPVLKLLLTVFEQGLTGILYLKNEDTLKVLYFSRGKLIWAISNSDEDKLENILMSKDLVDPETVKKIKREARVDESIGKMLVQKGLITLEELIDSSKGQLKHIIVSVLKWKHGGFQFIKDSPPERLISLDLDITDFIIAYIVEEVDLGEIWKTIGSLQIELIKNPDEKKVAQYPLSQKHLELLNGFDGETKLEGILTRYSGGHRESLLKIIYFFIMAELLIKKEFELSDLSAFDVEPEPDEPVARFDMNEPFETPDPGDFRGTETRVTREDHVYAQRETGEWAGTRARSIPGTPQMNSGGIASITAEVQPQPYSFKKTKNAEPEIPRFEAPRPAAPKNTSSPFSLPEEKKRSKLLNYVFILIFLVLVMGGVILLLLPWLDDEPNIREALKTNGNRDIIKIEDSSAQKDKVEIDPKTAAADNGGQTKPEIKPDTKTDTKTDTKPQIKPDTKPAAKKDFKEETKHRTETAKTPDNKNTPPPKPVTAKKTDKREDRTAEPQGKSAFSYFRNKNLITAADVWRRETKQLGVSHSILLEMDCQKASVLHAYRQIKDKTRFFLLTRTVRGKTCFLVLWGRFYSFKSAQDAIKNVPSYFKGQKDPPDVIELARYY